MNDQIVDVDGKPVEQSSFDPDNSAFPLMTGPTGRLYPGITKTELYACHLFAKHFNPSEDPAATHRLALRCVEAADVLAAATKRGAHHG